MTASQSIANIRQEISNALYDVVECKWLAKESIGYFCIFRYIARRNDNFQVRPRFANELSQCKAIG